MIKIWWAFLVPMVFCSKLNVPRVLLPLSPKHPVNFTLVVADDDNGCYSWTSSRPDVVLVIPSTDDRQCSKKATLIPTGLFTHKTSAIIVAKDLDSAQILRCDVILNHIHSLQISMKTHELFIEDAPEQFKVRAWDDQGNEFSSISDLPFEWSFAGQSGNNGPDNESILKWVKFEESLYVADPSVSKMEKEGLKGHTVLIEGVKTGSTTVSVKLRDEFFKNVPAVEARIVVQANLILEPSEIYVLPGSAIPVAVYLFRQGKATQIHLASSNYYLKAENSEIASVSEKDPVVQTGKIGTSRIYLLDGNMKPTDISHAPYVVVHVVYPHRLSLKLLPYLSWTTMIDETHSIQVEMHDEHGNFIVANDLVRIEAEIPSTFVVNYATNNGSYHKGIIQQLGSYEVKASLKSLNLPTGAAMPLIKTLETSSMLTVLPRIAIKPSHYVLAWDPVTAPVYRVKYEVVNGGESNEFFTSNVSFAVITPNGDANTRGPGWCRISTHPLGLSHLKATAKLHVLPVSDMTVLYQLVEIEVGSRFDIPITMKGVLPNNSIVAINDCLKVPLEAEFTIPELFKAQHTAAVSRNPGCRSVSVTSTEVGITTLTLSLKTESAILQQRVTISSYQPLRHERPRKGFVTLAIDSCYKVVLKGGPIQSSIHPVNHFRKVFSLNETVVLPSQAQILNKLGLKQGFAEILVCCSSEGESDVRYAVGATSTDSHMLLAEASISTRVNCVYPHRVSLLPSIRRPTEQNLLCKDQGEPNRHAIQDHVNSKIEMIVEDNFGRKLDNFSSYKVRWTVSDSNLAALNYIETTESDDIDARGYMSFQPYGIEGLFVINLFMALPEENRVPGEISCTLELNLVDAVTVHPIKSTILNHPDVKLSLKLLGGSGHYKVQPEPNDIAVVKHFKVNQTLQVTPQSSGNLEISIADRCLWSPKLASVSVQIVEISRIQLQVADKVELGSGVIMSVKMYDASDNLLDPKDLHSIKLEPVLGSSIVRVKSNGPLAFVLEGVALGETTIAVKAANRESPVLGLQVFPPLRISPRNLTLIVGAMFQVVGFGGPQPDSNIQYSIDGVDVATCSYNGIITAHNLGRTKVRARAVGADRNTGTDLVYSEDEAEIHIKPLSGIRIIAPMTRLRQGTEMPVSFAGLDDADTPFAFGDSIPPLKMEWTVTNTLSGTTYSLLYNNSKVALGDSDIAIRFTALQPGETVIKLKVTSKLEFQQLKTLQLTDELTIHVYETLTVSNLNSVSSQSLLMMPNTTLDLKTSIPAKRLVQSIEQIKRVIHSDNDGNLRSDTSVGHANLLLTSSNSHGIVQNQNLFVEVRPLSYLLPTASGILWDDVSQSLVIPRGFDARILVTYHDSLGRIFHSVRKDLKMRASRMDNHRISYDASKSMISFEGDHPGTTVLHIYDGIHPSVGVYVKLDVINAIYPEQLDFVVGDVICFTSPLLTSHGLQGKWSSDPKLLDIDGNSGVAIIAHEGVGQVKYHTAHAQTTVRDISATPTPMVRFLGAYNEVITNADGFTYRFPVSLRNKNEPSLHKSGCSTEKLEPYFAQRPSRLACHLSFAFASKEKILVSDLFTVESGFDIRSGFHQCIVKSVSPPVINPGYSITQVILKAEYGTVSADISLSWEPAFAVKTPEISFYDVEQSTFLEISAPASVTKHLEFLMSDTSALKLGDKHIELLSGIKIPIVLNSYYAARAASPITIEIRNKRTDQTEKVVVYFGQSKAKSRSTAEPGLLSAVWNFIQYHAINVLTLAVTCVAIYLGYRAITKTTYYHPQANGSYPRTPPKRPIEKPSPLNTSYYYAKRSPSLWSVPNESISSPLFDQSAHSAFRTSLLSDKSNYSE